MKRISILLLLAAAACSTSTGQPKAPASGQPKAPPPATQGPAPTPTPGIRSRLDPTVIEETETSVIRRLPKTDYVKVDDRHVKLPILGDQTAVEFYKEDDKYYYVSEPKALPEEIEAKRRDAGAEQPRRARCVRAAGGAAAEPGRRRGGFREHRSARRVQRHPPRGRGEDRPAGRRHVARLLRRGRHERRRHSGHRRAAATAWATASCASGSATARGPSRRGRCRSARRASPTRASPSTTARSRWATSTATASRTSFPPRTARGWWRCTATARADSGSCGRACRPRNSPRSPWRCSTRTGTASSTSWPRATARVRSRRARSTCSRCAST